MAQKCSCQACCCNCDASCDACGKCECCCSCGLCRKPVAHAFELLGNDLRHHEKQCCESKKK